MLSFQVQIFSRDSAGRLKQELFCPSAYGESLDDLIGSQLAGYLDVVLREKLLSGEGYHRTLQFALVDARTRILRMVYMQLPAGITVEVIDSAVADHTNLHVTDLSDLEARFVPSAADPEVLN